MGVYEEFLRMKRHPDPRYGCVCGLAHVGAPDTVIGHFFQAKYGRLYTDQFFAYHYWVSGRYYPYVGCKHCGARVVVDSPEDWDKADEFIRNHKCK